MKILIVCTGNVCRSPLAAAMLKQRLAERGRTDVEVVSAGTAAADGEPASEGSYLVALEHGVDLSAHAARLLTRRDVDDADLILCMSEHHVQRCGELGGTGRAHLLGSYAGRKGRDAIVEDPFGGDLREYRTTYAQLDQLLEAVVDRLLKDTHEQGRAGT